jgi:glucose/arabinose dehydrogenase
VVAGGVVAPWELVFLPDGSALVTERPGRVRRLVQGSLEPEPLLTLNVVTAPGAEGGMLGMALHPAYPNPPDVYIYYTYRGSAGNTNRVSRFRYEGGRLINETVVLDGIPGGPSYHFGGRMAFGPDGMLYVTTGEGFIASRAADRGSLGGKLLRVRDDGSVPPDNPFAGSPVYAFGLRNPQGLAWDRDGHLYVSDHGPTGEFGLCCHDELNLIQAGGFYGWPLFAGNTPAGRPQDYPAVPQSIPPIAESGLDTWAPSGLAFYTPSAAERPTLLMATLRGEALRRFVIDPAQPSQVVAQEVVLSGQGRLRAVVQGRDGCAYVLTNNRDSRGSPRPDDDRVLRLCRQA